MLYKPKILIVDDDKDVLESLKYFIQKKFKKFDVLACNSAEEAFNRIKQYDQNGEPIAFVLSDERMPGMSEGELKIKKRTNYQRIKIILIKFLLKNNLKKIYKNIKIKQKYRK